MAPPKKAGPQGTEEQKDVMAELGDAAPASEGVQDVGEQLAQNADAGEDQSDGSLAGEADTQNSKTNRQRRTAANRKRLADEAAEMQALEAQALADAGVVAPGQIRDMDADPIPSDSDGNPLWYYNPKSKRVVRGNASLHKSTINKKMKLIPCMPPMHLREDAAEEA